MLLRAAGGGDENRVASSTTEAVGPTVAVLETPPKTTSGTGADGGAGVGAVLYGAAGDVKGTAAEGDDDGNPR